MTCNRILSWLPSGAVKDAYSHCSCQPSWLLHLPGQHYLVLCLRYKMSQAALTTWTPYMCHQELCQERNDTDITFVAGFWKFRISVIWAGCPMKPRRKDGDFRQGNQKRPSFKNSTLLTLSHKLREARNRNKELPFLHF